MAVEALLSQSTRELESALSGCLGASIKLGPQTAMRVKVDEVRKRDEMRPFSGLLSHGREVSRFN